MRSLTAICVRRKAKKAGGLMAKEIAGTVERVAGARGRGWAREKR